MRVSRTRLRRWLASETPVLAVTVIGVVAFTLIGAAKAVELVVLAELVGPFTSSFVVYLFAITAIDAFAIGCAYRLLNRRCDTESLAPGHWLLLLIAGTGIVSGISAFVISGVARSVPSALLGRQIAIGSQGILVVFICAYALLVIGRTWPWRAVFALACVQGLVGALHEGALLWIPYLDTSVPSLVVALLDIGLVSAAVLLDRKAHIARGELHHLGVLCYLSRSFSYMVLTAYVTH